ncbi:Transient receptor potential cation channel subfamily A member 1 [Fasciolopsis buskii]|uniref:Transient receptor potential cation channel subfamily A member 1 n=1 Tax=Fasciolopsis buskii TaxID=27845 RepID=A0A8E0RV18_9TREM|nr:Transient receptor potential cation channel subfamily A member 1 [Fasciolopsis buski]
MRILKLYPNAATKIDEDGNLPVHLAAKHGYPQVLKKLLEHSSLVNDKNGYGWTPLMHAAANNQIDCVKLLLSEGAKVNSKDKSKFTPLFVACQRGYSDVVQELLLHGALPGIRVIDTHALYPGWNCLDIAIHENRIDCVRQIIQSDHWEVALHNLVTDDQGTILNPLRRMIIQMPGILNLASVYNMKIAIAAGCVHFLFVYYYRSWTALPKYLYFSEAVELVFARCVHEDCLPANALDHTITFDFRYLADDNMFSSARFCGQVREAAKRNLTKLPRMLFQFVRDRLSYFNVENLLEVVIYVLTLLTTVDSNMCMMRTGLREHVFERYSSTEPDKQVHYEFLTYLLFIIFLALMCIVMMNLLVGLAVDDIKGVQRKAALRRQEMRVQLLLAIESTLSRFGQLSAMPLHYEYRPNNWKTNVDMIFHQGYRNYQKTAKEFDGKPEDESVDFAEIEKAVKSIRVQNLEIAKLLNKVVDRLNMDSGAYRRTSASRSKRSARNAPLAIASTSGMPQLDLSAGLATEEGPQLPSDLAEAPAPTIERLNVDEDYDQEPVLFSA